MKYELPSLSLKLTKISRQYPQKVAVKDDSKTVSYLQLEKRSNKIANFLYDRVKSVKNVLIVLDRSAELIESIIGLLKGGLIFVPVDPVYPGRRIEKMLKTIRGEWVITSKKYYEKLKKISRYEEKNLKFLLIDGDADEFESSSNTFCLGPDVEEDLLVFENEPNKNCYIYFTSGSTGTPKGVLGRQRSLAHFIDWEIKEFGIDETFNISQFTSPSFDPFLRDIFVPLMAGGTCCIPGYNTLMNPRQFLKWIDKNEITLIHIVPSLFRVLIPGIENSNCFHNLRYILLAGELLRGNDIRQFVRIFKDRIQLVNLYGPTETTMIKLFYKIKEKDEDKTIIPIGKPIDGARVMILDRNLQPCRVGKRGEIHIQTPFISSGYYNDPGLNKKYFIKNPFNRNPRDIIYKTGDLARLLPDGNVEISGRIDHQVKIRGVRVELGEIENEILKHPGIKDVAVVAKHDASGDKYLCAYIISTKELDAAALREHLSGNLPGNMIPSYFIQIESIPLNPNGKLDRKALPEPGVGKTGVSTPYAAPGDELEEKLVKIWSEVLGIEEKLVGIDAGFFDLGGHSLKATRLVARLYKELNVELPLLRLFGTPTIRDLSAYIKGSAKNKYCSLTASEKKEFYSLSSAQERLYILQQMEPERTTYNISQVVVLEGHLEKERFQETLRKLIDRHESFKTSFEMVEDEPIQKLHSEMEFEIQYYCMENGVAASRTNDDESPIHVPDAACIIENFVRPFDLSEAPLLRVGIVKIKEIGHILMLDMHHIISDGISIGLFIKEFMSIYAGKELPPLKLHYKDYSETQDREGQKGAIKQQEAYWLKQFEGEIPVLNLPLDYPREAARDFTGSQLRFELSVEQTKALNDLAINTGTTLYMVLLAIYSILLSKLSGQEDIVVGTPAAGRQHPDLEKIIGMFVNTLAMRNYPEGKKTFKDFLGEIKTRTLKAFENQQYQFENLVDRVAVNRDPSRNPLFDTMLTFQNMESVEIDIPGIKLKKYNYQRNTSKFDLTLIGMEVEEGLQLIFEYSTNLFKKETIERFATYLKKIVSTIGANADVKVCDVEIMEEEEKRKILDEFNNTTSQYPRDKVIHELFTEQAKKNPDSMAVIGPSQSAAERRKPWVGGHAVTYRELNEKSNQMARVLRQKGVQPDAIVGIMVERSIEMVVGIMGILKAGGAYLPIDPEYPEERKQYILKDSGAKILVTVPGLSEKFEKLSIVNCQLSINEDTSPAAVFSNPEPETRNAQLAYVIYTSGSTGRPKGVPVQHGSVVNILLALFKKYSLLKKDTCLLKTTYTFDVSVSELFGWYLGGGRLAILEPGGEKDPLTILDWIQRIGITHINFVPSMFGVFLEILDTRKVSQLSHLKYIFLAGETLTPHLVTRFNQFNTGILLENIYGPTESTIYASQYSLSAWQGVDGIPIGTPLNNIRLYVLNSGGQLQPIGVWGELCIGGEGLAPGYLNRPELTAEKFIKQAAGAGDRRRCEESSNEKFFGGARGRFLHKYPPYASRSRRQTIYKTGDLARWLADGNIEFLGRIDHQVKIRGFRIELGEIESQLLKHKEIKEAVVMARNVGTNHGIGDKYLCAYIVADNELEIDGLRKYLAKGLPDYMIPSCFVPMENIPLTVNGKVNRKALPEPQVTGGENYIPPRNRLEERLVEIWSGVLGIEKDNISINADFFELGGNSLKAIMLTAKIHKELNIKLTLGELFKIPTIRRLSGYMKELKENRFSSIKPTEKKEYYELSSAQMRLYIHQQVNLRDINYNILQFTVIEGALELRKLENTFVQLVKRHESLRTSFGIIDEGPVQRIHEDVSLKIEFFDLHNKNRGNFQSTLDLTKSFVRPFDLSRAPLLKVRVVKEENSRHILMVSMHHIISDGVSMAVLIKEFAHLYENVTLPGLRLQYRDYSQWQNKLMETQYMKQQEQYWMKQFEGGIPSLNLLTDYQRDDDRDVEGDFVYLQLGEELCGRLKQLTIETKTTFYIVLLTVYYILLSKYTGQDDIILASGIAARGHADLEKVIGMFVNMLVIRSRPSENKTFIDFLREVKENTLDAFENQDFQFDQLVKKLGLTKDWFSNPVTNTQFTFHNIEEEPIEKIGNITFKPYNGYQRTVLPIELSLNGLKIGENVSLRFGYLTSLFERTTVERMANYYNEILIRVMENQDIEIGDIKTSYDLSIAESNISQDEYVSFEF